MVFQFLGCLSLCTLCPLFWLPSCFFQDSGQMGPTWWSLSWRTPFPGRFDPFCLFAQGPLLHLLSRQSVYCLPSFVRTIPPPPPDGKVSEPDWVFICLPCHPFSWVLKYFNKLLKKVVTLHLSILSLPLLKLGWKWEGAFERKWGFSRFNKALEEMWTPALSYPILLLPKSLREVLW